MAGKKLILIAVAAVLLIAGAFLARPLLAPPEMSAARFDAHQQEALDAMNRAIDLCQSKYRYGELKTHQQEAECATPGIVDAFRDAGFPFMDLIQAFAAERVGLGKKLDRNQITQLEAQDEDAKFLAELQAEARTRRKAVHP